MAETSRVGNEELDQILSDQMSRFQDSYQADSAGFFAKTGLSGSRTGSKEGPRRDCPKLSQREALCHYVCDRMYSTGANESRW